MAEENIASPADVQNNLEGVEYPASKSEMLEYAKQQGASDDVISTIEKLPEKEYGSQVDVSSELGNIKSR